MSYKLNKNLTTAFLAMFIILNNAEICRAQGVVSLVEDDNAGVEDDVFAPSDTAENNLNMDMDLPNSISDDDFIPLDDGLITPAEPAQAPEASAPQPAPAAQAAPIEDKQPADQADEFSLGLPQNASSLFAESTEQSPLLPPEASEDALLAAEGKIANLAQTSDKFANTVLSKIDNDLFSQMSDIEKQTTLLTLELRREKIRNEIEAIRAQREKAIADKIAAEREKERLEEEWKKEQEAKVLREQQALKEKEIELEKLKQRKMLTSYMNQMLQQNQKWIEENAQLHKQMRDVEEDRKNLVENFKSKLDNLVTLSNKLTQNANTAKSNHDRTVASLTAQNVQLKKRIEADELAAKNREQNPFAAGSANGAPAAAQANASDFKPVNLAKEYAIMEISGKGENLVARLINKDGESFVVKNGSMLHTGHMVDNITERYVQFDRNGLKDYLYTSGGAITSEPEKMEGTASVSTAQPKPAIIIKPSKGTAPNAESSLPSLGSGMFVK